MFSKVTTFLLLGSVLLTSAVGIPGYSIPTQAHTRAWTENREEGPACIGSAENRPHNHRWSTIHSGSDDDYCLDVRIAHFDTFDDSNCRSQSTSIIESETASTTATGTWCKMSVRKFSSIIDENSMNLSQDAYRVNVIEAYFCSFFHKYLSSFEMKHNWIANYSV